MNLNETKHEHQNQAAKSNEGEGKFIQISPESIELMADSIGYGNISSNVSKSLAEDSSYRLRELLQSCVQILQHSKRPKLTNDDVNLAFRWSDIPILHGQSPLLTDYYYLPELDLHAPVDRPVDLTKPYTTCSEVEVYSPMKLSTLYLVKDSEKSDDKTRKEVHIKYFEKLSQCLLSTSENMLEMALTNLQENSQLQPLLLSLTSFLQSLVQYGNENWHVAKRIPLIFRALVNNPHLNIEPQRDSFLKLLLEMIIKSDERIRDEDMFLLISAISHILGKMSFGSSIQDFVQDLSCLITDPNRGLMVQCRALLTLRLLSCKFVQMLNLEHWNALLTKLSQESGNKDENYVFLQEIIASAVIDLLRSKIYQIENEFDNSCLTTWREGNLLYNRAYDILGCQLLRIGEFPSLLCQRLHHHHFRKNPTENRELYWTIKSYRKPTPQSKWKYLNGGNRRNIPLNRTDIKTCFDCSETYMSSEKCIKFNVANWKQQPPHRLKRRTIFQNETTQHFATLCNNNLKPVSECLIVPTIIYYYNPVDLII